MQQQTLAEQKRRLYGPREDMFPTESQNWNGYVWCYSGTCIITSQTVPHTWSQRFEIPLQLMTSDEPGYRFIWIWIQRGLLLDQTLNLMLKSIWLLGNFAYENNGEIVWKLKRLAYLVMTYKDLKWGSSEPKSPLKVTKSTYPHPILRVFEQDQNKEWLQGYDRWSSTQIKSSYLLSHIWFS